MIHTTLSGTFIKIAISVAALFAVGQAGAGLVGSTVKVSIVDHQGFYSSTTTVTDPGSEFMAEDRAVDVFDDYFTVTGTHRVVYGEYTHTLTLEIDALLAAELQSVSLETSTTHPFLASRLTFSGNTIVLNYAVFDSYEGDVIRVNFHFGNVEDVPEPASIALVGLGMLGMGFARRKRKQA